MKIINCLPSLFFVFACLCFIQRAPVQHSLLSIYLFVYDSMRVPLNITVTFDIWGLGSEGD